MYSVAFDIGTNYISGMMMRKIQYRLYPNSTQTAALEEACELHRQLYNAALEERIAAYRMCGVSVTFVQQDASLTVIRNEHPAYAGATAQGASGDTATPGSGIRRLLSPLQGRRDAWLPALQSA